MTTALAKHSKAQAARLVSDIRHKKQEIARAFFDIGVLLRELHVKKLYGALGYASFDEMLESEGLMSGQYARRLVQVATAFDREQALRLGAEKAYALVRYCARTKLEDDPAEYVLEGFPVAGGKRRPIDEIGVRDIAEATRIAVLRQKGELAASEIARKDAATAARKVHAKLSERTSGAVHVSHVFRRGSWWLTISIPAEMAPAIK